MICRKIKISFPGALGPESSIVGRGALKGTAVRGVKSKFITIPGAGHGFRDGDAERAMRELVTWFEDHLVAAN